MLKSMTMLNFKRGWNPYLSGLKPRKFFSTISEDVKRSQFTKDGRQFNPDWNKKAA